MRTQQIFYITVLLIFAHTTTVMGQASKGIILLNNFQQAVDFFYQYNGQTTSSDNLNVSFRDHEFAEAYRFNVDYGLYSPRLLKGHLFTELKYDQDRFSGTNEPSGGTTGLNFRYHVNGTFLDRHPYPVTFFAGSQVANVPRPFSSTLNVKTDNYGAGFILKNNFLPLQFNYNYSQSATTGFLTERDQSFENFAFQTNHRIRDFSDTKIELIFSKVHTTSNGGLALGESYLTNDASISNSLAWKVKENTANLFSSYRYRQEAGDRQSNTSDFGESLVWYFGKALETGIKYSNTMQQSLSETQMENIGDIWLRHRLFQNLRTFFQAEGRSEKYSTGHESELSGTLLLDYQKALSANNRLQLGFSRTYGVIDRNLGGSRIFIKDEKITASFLGPITLKNLDIIPDTIVIRNAANTAITYSPTTDYTVDQISKITLITINPGGTIPSGTQLLVDYQINVNPSIKYAQNSQNIYGMVLLADGRYKISANLENYDQEYISGRLDSSNLLQSRTFRTGVEYNGEQISARGEYINYDSTYSIFQSYEASVNYTKDYIGSTLSLFASDRLTFRESPPTATSTIIVPGAPTTAASSGTSSSDNSVNAGATYIRDLLNLATMKVTANYLNVSGKFPRDGYSLGFDLQTRIGKTIAKITSEIHWLFEGNSTRRDDKVSLMITRYL